MNRNERRKRGLDNNDPTYNIKKSTLDAIRKQVKDEYVSEAFTLMLAIPVMAIHDHYSDIMKKNGREERFCDLCLRIYGAYEKGEVSIEDLRTCLYEEAGIKIE